MKRKFRPNSPDIRRLINHCWHFGIFHFREYNLRYVRKTERMKEKNKMGGANIQTGVWESMNVIWSGNSYFDQVLALRPLTIKPNSKRFKTNRRKKNLSDSQYGQAVQKNNNNSSRNGNAKHLHLFFSHRLFVVFPVTICYLVWAHRCRCLCIWMLFVQKKKKTERVREKNRSTLPTGRYDSVHASDSSSSSGTCT